MSYFTKARAWDYYNNLLTGNDADFMKLITKHCICPPNEIGGYRGKKLREIDTRTSTDPRLQSRTDLHGVRLARVEKNKKVGYVNLSLKPRGDYTVTGNEGGDHIYFNASYDHDHTWGGIPVWYFRGTLMEPLSA